MIQHFKMQYSSFFVKFILTPIAPPQYTQTYLLTPWCRVLLEQLTGLQLVKKFPAFHGTRRFITTLTSVRQLSLSWASPIQSIYLHPTSWRSILILSTHLHLGLPSGIFPSGFPTKTLYTPHSSPIRATCPAHLILLDFITRTILGEEYKSFSSSLYTDLVNLIKCLWNRIHLEEVKVLGWSRNSLPLVETVEIFKCLPLHLILRELNSAVPTYSSYLLNP